MTGLFNEYKDAGNISKALLVGKNMVNKNPDNYEMFQEYMELLISLSEKLPSLSERKNFIGQANITLAFFEENAVLTSELIVSLEKYKEKINTVVKNIEKEEKEKINIEFKKLEDDNNKYIQSLYVLKQKLSNTKTQEEFDNVLQEISFVDSNIKHDYMTEKQKVNYNQINKKCTACISDKMRQLEYKDNVAYNQKAVDSYNNAFRKFKDNEEKYKNQIQLFSLVSSTLFAYDAERLFNETLIYYNHVYSYIFSRLDDDGKLALTRFSIECERK